MVYMDGEPVATSQQYYEQAEDIAAAGTLPPDSEVNDDDILPLGTFTFTPSTDSEAKITLQMDLNKDGTITGTYFNLATNTTLPILGSVDKESQRAAWTIGDKKDVICETGLYNLTKDQTDVLVHTSKTETQTWMLTRLVPEGEDENAATDGAAETGATPAPPPPPAPTTVENPFAQ